MQSDLAKIGRPSLSELNSSKKPEAGAQYVLQVAKARNIAAPKADPDNAHAPPLLRVTLTDGLEKVDVVLLNAGRSLNVSHIPPGTKILLTDATKINKYVSISANSFC